MEKVDIDAESEDGYTPLSMSRMHFATVVVEDGRSGHGPPGS